MSTNPPQVISAFSEQEVPSSSTNANQMMQRPRTASLSQSQYKMTELGNQSSTSPSSESSDQDDLEPDIIIHTSPPSNPTQKPQLHTRLVLCC